MITRFLTALILAAGLAFAGACSTASPAAPSPPAPANALPNQTLKATSPDPQSPKDDVRLDGLRASLVVSNSRGEFTDGQFDYRFEVVNPANQVIYTARVSGQAGSTRHDLPMDLDLDTRYRWRARAEREIYSGPWSSFVSFLTIDYRGIVPRPPNGNWPSDPEAVVAYIADSFPEFLEPTGSLEERIHNMEFLRDRIIEAGICGGLDVGRNLKRGTGPHSHDAIAWRHSPSNVDVIDIASGFDDFGSHLHLHWIEVDGPPGFDGYPEHPGC